MGQPKLQPIALEVAGRQHGVIAREQLLAVGLNKDAIQHRIQTGWLHPVRRGVYAVGQSELTPHGQWMSAVLGCGRGAALSHLSAAALWEIWTGDEEVIHVSVAGGRYRQQPGVAAHRRYALTPEELTEHCGIPVTSPTCTLIDISLWLSPWALERALMEADRLDLVTPAQVRAGLARVRSRPGMAPLRKLLDRHSYVLTDSDLEQRFVPLATGAGLPAPLTQQIVNGYRVDFYWPDLGLVVETDGLRYHRTPAQQARDRLRDQAHTAAGLTPLRFTHGQVRYEPGYVRATLARTAAQARRRLQG